jgi:hypothetical protein
MRLKNCENDNVKSHLSDMMDGVNLSISMGNK